MYTILKSTEIKELREKLHTEQNMICPVCNTKIEFDSTCLDHKHVYKGDTIGENGAGLVRGVLCNTCNGAEGRILGVLKRLGMHKKGVNFSDVLRNLADYLDKEPLPYLHPTEVPKGPKIKKSLYNKLKKLYDTTERKKKFPDFPKSGKLTKALKDISEEFNMPLT